MKYFFKVLLIIFFIIGNINFINASYVVNVSIEKAYNNFIKKVEKKYTSISEISYLEKFDKKLHIILSTKKLSEKQETLINDLIYINNEKLFKLRTFNIESQSKQIFKEISLKNKLLESLKKSSLVNIPSYVKNIGKKIYFLSEEREFVIDNKVKRITFDKYFNIDNTNYKNFYNKSGIIIKIDGKNNYFFLDNYSFNEKTPYSKASKYFQDIITTKTNFYINNNIYYSYNFINYKYITDKYGFYKADLEEKFGDLTNIVLFIDENKIYNFVTNYEKTRLIKSDIIFGVADKINFLTQLISDKKGINTNLDKYFLELKDEVNSLTYRKSKEKKVENIYEYILNNISYSEAVNLSDSKIFSGIDTYKNKSGVCNGYTKLLSYMLMFSGINDSEMIKGYILDAKDFPDIGHSWVRVGEYYYDVTFDDPLGPVIAKTKSEYKYFKLPKDLFYTNRYTYESMPSNLKTTSLTYRKNLINKNLSSLVTKYVNTNYLLLNPFKFKNKHNIDYNNSITIDDLKDIIPYAEVNNFSFKLNGTNKYIKKINYYQIDNDNIDTTLDQFNYNIKDLYLFKWNLDNGTYEYRLAFEFEF